MLVPSLFGQSQVTPLNSTQLLAWLTGGVSSNRLSRLARERKIDFVMSEDYVRCFRAAGADTALIQSLRQLSAKGASLKGAGCSPALAKAAELSHQKKY